MKTKPYLFISTSIKRTALLAIIFTTLSLASFAHAATINFDDLTYVPRTDTDFDCFCDHPLADEYRTQGLRIYNGYLATYGNYTRPEMIVSPRNFLLGGPNLQLQFTGTLPTSVSMYVSSALEDAIFVEAYGTAGLISIIQTPGYAGPPDDIFYVPKQYVSFYSAAGISDITLTSYYGSRVGAIVDDLKFDYAKVPEPSSLILLCIGLLMFWWRCSTLSIPFQSHN